ncbi:putative F-box/FBD/LRR-repeat protein At5g25850 [Silene latifolia]|uniref:putative F-box/FBD/LRR-repeat protein At5g25850 n=1 Tax=Silene latifolia TaxID=37657 RepID=UPI003D78B0D2
MPTETLSVDNRQHHLWSSLPDDIIFDLFSRLGLPREAVITVSTTKFIIKQILKPTYNIYEFWTALDNFFTVFIPPLINTFCLNLHTDHYDEPRCWPIIDAWARRLSTYNIQHFTANKFCRYRSDDHVYPISIFRMHSLVSLELNLCPHIALNAPRYINLPNLKKLILYSINYRSLKALLSCCPSLEYLFLSVNEPKYRLVSLTSKKLKRLCITLEGPDIHDVVIDAPILEKLDYSSKSILSMPMLDKISNVKSLELRVCSTNLGRNLIFKRTFIFPNLTRLQLTMCSPEIFKAIGLMVHCPKLDVFVLRVINPNKMVWNQEAVFVPVEHVKRIELHTGTLFNQFGEEMLNLVTLLLRSAKVLEKLILMACGSLSNYTHLAKNKFYRALYECVEATSRCQVKFLGAYKRT